MSENAPPKRYKARIIASGVYKHMTVTREAVESAAELLADRPVPVNIEHDPTNPPVGRMVDPELVQLDDGELALEATVEVRANQSIPAIIRAVSDYELVGARLKAIEPQAGALELDIDVRSYNADDLEALRTAAAGAGEVSATRNAARFSELPDALLTVSLGTSAVAAFWFAKGFFTRLGEQAAESIGPDLASAYESFKQNAKKMLSRRNPADQPPLTVMTLELERDDGGTIDVEGSSRAEGDDIEDFFDSGEELLTLARTYAKMIGEPEKLRKLHFARQEGTWRLRYGLDADAHPVLGVAMPEEEFEKLVEHARSKPDTSVDGAGTAFTERNP
jgi:hypothetical protein